MKCQRRKIFARKGGGLALVQKRIVTCESSKTSVYHLDFPLFGTKKTEESPEWTLPLDPNNAHSAIRILHSGGEPQPSDNIFGFKQSKETAGTAELVGPSLAVEAEPVRVEPVVFEASEPHVATAEKEIVAEGDGIAVEGTERGPFSEEFSDFLEEEMVGETETEATAGDRAVLGVDSEDWTECVVMPGVDDRGVEYVEAGSLLNGVALTAGVTTGLDEVVGEAVEHGLIEDERLGQAAFGAPVEEQEVRVGWMWAK